jgi:serine/threonine-protein kinase
MLERTVAIKQLKRTHLGKTDSLRRFTREARILGQLAIPGTPVVYDLDRDVIGCPLLAMNHIEGETLTRILHRLRNQEPDATRDYPIEMLIRCMLQVAQTLMLAEAAGVVHLDVKPENIMIDEHQQTWLIDWGSAAIKDHDATEQATDGKSFFGSPAYASPEQIRGEVVGNTSDIYSFGAVLYDCLALDTMIQAETRNQAIKCVLQGNHRPPSERSLRSSVPGALENVCLRATAMNPEDRYRSVREMRDALNDAYLDALMMPLEG